MDCQEYHKVIVNKGNGYAERWVSSDDGGAK